jgi:hypothetical protein
MEAFMKLKIHIYIIRDAFVTFFLLFFICNITNAQGRWAYVYGSSNNEKPYCIMQTTDNGFIAVGTSNSFSASGDDYWLIKLNNTGSISWQEYFSTLQSDIAYSVWQTIDGGYVIGGESSILSAPNKDLLVIKTDSSGGSNWQKIYSSGYASQFASIQQTADNGYIMGASTIASLSNISQSSDVWVIKLTSTGNVSWQYLYGSESNEYARFVKPTSDGGYIVAADALYNMTEESDIWILKLSSTGAVSWQRKFGWAFSQNSNENAHAVEQTSDGGYIVAGTTNTYGAGNKDIWVLKLDSSGNPVWQRTYGGAMDDAAYSIVQTNDGGFVLTGFTDSAEPDNRDAIVIKLDPNGNIIWQKRYGGPYTDEGYSIKQTNDGGFIIAINSYALGAGFNDFLIIKTDSNGEIDPLCNIIHNVNLTSTSTNASPSSLIYNISASAINIFNMNINPASAPISTAIICSSSPGAVPDNDNYAGTPLTISKSGANQLTLSWGAPPEPCITTDYSIYRGSLPFNSYNHSYLLCSTSGMTSATINSETDSYYYLIVAQYNNAEGSYGVDSNNIQRPIGINYCYQQHIGSCN